MGIRRAHTQLSKAIWTFRRIFLFYLSLVTLLSYYLLWSTWYDWVRGRLTGQTRPACQKQTCPLPRSWNGLHRAPRACS